jgi:FkbM family methyltransferase
MGVKKFIRRIINQLGFEIIRLSQNPRQTLLGLRSLPFRTVIDVGANRGQFAQHILNIFPQATLFCFEPLQKPFQDLQSWVKSNPDKNIYAFNTAIGDYEGKANIFCHTDHDYSSSLLSATDKLTKLYPITDNKNQLEINIVTLDGVLKEYTDIMFDNILIKLDVQGYENNVIRGGKDIFNKSKACIIEVNLEKLYQDQADFKEIYFLLADHGYEYSGNLDQTYDSNGQVIYFDAVFIRK